MSDPTALKIGPDDSEKIIDAADAEQGIPYLVEVADAPVRFSHQKPAVDRGPELSQGQTHTLSNLRDKPIYLTGVGGTATVRVRPAGADVQSQPVKGVTIEGDVVVSDAATESKQDDIISELKDIKSVLNEIETNTSN